MLKLAKNTTTDEDLLLPIAAVTQKFAFMGRSSSGKTYGSTKLAEEMLNIGAQIMVLDVVGNWYGLRIPKDKRNAPFNIVIFGGSHADIEINPKAGKIVAGIIVEKNLSAVVDISEFIEHEQMRFTYDFLTELFRLRKESPRACHLFIEEAQELVPQTLPPSQKGEESFGAKMLHAAQRILKIGRNYGIGATIITQRPQDVNKKVLNQTEVLLAFQMTGIQEKKTIAEWIRDKGQDENLADNLSKLEIGNALVWSPAWLKISGMYKISEKLTADVSATPEVGVDNADPQKLEPLDVSELSESIKALTVELEANTPSALKAEIAKLKTELAASQKNAENMTNNMTATVAEPEPVYVRVLDTEKLDELHGVLNAFRTDFDAKVNAFLQAVKEAAERLCFNSFGNTPIDRLLGELRNSVPELPISVAKQVNSPSNDGTKHATTSRNFTKRSEKTPNVTHSSETTENLKSHVVSSLTLPAPQQKILDALAFSEALGNSQPERISVAFFAGYTVNGHFNNTVGTLKTNGLVTYPIGGHISLTTEGRAAADRWGIEIGSLSDLHELWKSKLSEPQSRILDVLLNHRGRPISREDLAAQSGYTVNGHFNNVVGTLKTLGAACYPQKGVVAAAPVMFPEGLS